MKKIFLACLSLFILTLVLKLPTIQRPFDLAYENQLAFFGREAFTGGGFYSTPWSMKPPGESFVYGLTYLLFGYKSWVLSVRILTAVLTGLGAIFLLVTVGRLYGFWSGLISALFFSVFLCRGDTFGGNLSYAEMLMPFFTILGVFLFFLAKEKKKNSLFLFSGMSLGISLLFKQSAVYDFLPLFVYSVGESLLKKEKLSIVFIFHFLFGLGFILPMMIFLFYIILLGKLSLFWDWMVVKPALYAKLREKAAGGYILDIFKKVYLVWVLAYLGMLGGIFRRERKTIVFIVWFFFTFLTFITSGKFWNYYFIQSFIPACFLAGSFIGDISALVKKRILLFILILTLLAVLLRDNYRFYSLSFKRLLSAIQKKVTFEDYIFSQSDGESWINRFKSVEYLKEKLKKEDKIFVMEGTPVIYVMADKEPVYKDFIFEQQFFENRSIGFAFNHSFQTVDGNRKTLIDNLQGDPPSYIIIVIGSAGEAYDKLQSFPYFFAFTFLNYNYEANFGDVWIYAKKENILIPQKVLIEQNFYKKYFGQ